MTGKLPLVYSCSGCSSAAQMANQMALWLDRAGAAEMSCIAGVGGGVTGLVRTAQSGRAILALDGCVLHCVRACLERAGVSADTHLTLSDHGVRKRRHADFLPEQAETVYRQTVLPAARALHAAGPVPVAIDPEAGEETRAVPP
ncbi:zinc-binding protein [Pseudoxanthomonas daejeonensis]|uniref:Zinc-binding protein n=1 Tax=Pseudoxanthomonas daejeonensis TaxID=266062 RepID=A0ABQ6Z3L2_9GAMM|nr:putative zinc-binding protein [Pseudoxanthomonas daejeonensis]KAF1692080.1 zinc-binding protein [Pseudoxanthomonas daejeonensis]UNK58347.1 zinc-binding protein [Pseudoxanthomonas daejeonensis]